MDLNIKYTYVSYVRKFIETTQAILAIQDIEATKDKEGMKQIEVT